MKRSVLIFGALLISLLIAHITNTSQVWAQSLEHLGSTLWSGMNDVKVVGNYAYCAFASGLGIIDISSPASPMLLGKIRCSGLGKYLDVSGNYAFLLSHNEGLRIIDILDPAQPQISGSYGIIDATTDICVMGEYAVIGVSGQRLKIVDISDPSNPTSLFEISSVAADRIASYGDYLYSIDDNIFDVFYCDLPDSIRHTGSLIIDSDAQDIYALGSYVYVVEGDRWNNPRFEAINISDPESPFLAGSCTLPGSPVRVFAGSDYAYVTNGWFGLQVIDISEPGGPFLVGQYGGNLAAYNGIWKSGLYVYAVDEAEGLLVYNVSDPESATLSGEYRMAGWVRDFFVRGQYAYETDVQFTPNDGYNFNILDLTNLSSPSTVSHIQVDSSFAAIAVQGNYSYLSGLSLHLFDIANPRNPVEIDTISLQANGGEISLSGNYAYIALGGYVGIDGVEIVNIADPSNPLVTSTYLTHGNANDIYVDGNYAYVSTCGDDVCGFEIINISDPEHPSSTGFFPLGCMSGVYVEGNYTYLAAGALVVFDISDPANASMVAVELFPASIEDVVVSDGFAYAAADNKGYIINVSNPADPTLVSSIDLYDAWKIERAGNVLFLLDRYSVEILRILGDTSGCHYMPGDINGSGQANGIDIVYGVSYMKGGNPPPDACYCPPMAFPFYASGDVNGNCAFNGIDITYYVAYLKGIQPALRWCETCPP